MMDPRWKRLFLLLGVVAILFVASVFLAGVFSFLGENQAAKDTDAFAAGFSPKLNSFNAVLAGLNAKLDSQSGFDVRYRSFASARDFDLILAKENLTGFKQSVESAQPFGEKEAALALADVWIYRLDAQLAWKQLQTQNQSLHFSSSDSDGVVCAQKSALVLLKEPISKTVLAVEKLQQVQNDFVSRFPNQARAAGIEPLADTSEDLAGLNQQQKTIDEIAEACP